MRDPFQRDTVFRAAGGALYIYIYIYIYQMVSAWPLVCTAGFHS